MTHEQKALILAVYEAAKEGDDIRAVALEQLPAMASAIEAAYHDGDKVRWGTMPTEVVLNQGLSGFGLSPLARQRLKAEGLVFEFDELIPRHHPALVAVVKELGEDADGFGSALEVVTVPGNRYRITEDEGGMERVETPHSIPWVTVTCPRTGDHHVREGRRF